MGNCETAFPAPLDIWLAFARLIASHVIIEPQTMDSKHRHELEQNILAKWLTDQYQGWIRPNSSWLGYAVVGVLVVAAIIMGTTRVNAWNRAAAWKQYYAALHSEQADTELEAIAHSTTGIVGVYARLALAQRQLSEGCSQVFTDKAQSIAVLEKAIASFQQVQKNASDPMLLQQADFGLSQCWETLAAARIGDDLANAEEEYQTVAERWRDSFMGQRAQKRLALIRQPSTKMFIELMAAKTVAPSETDGFDWKFDFADPLAPEGQIDFGTFEETEEEITIEETDTEEPKTETAEPEQEPEI